MTVDEMQRVTLGTRLYEVRGAVEDDDYVVVEWVVVRASDRVVYVTHGGTSRVQTCLPITRRLANHYHVEAVRAVEASVARARERLEEAIGEVDRARQSLVKRLNLLARVRPERSPGDPVRVAESSTSTTR